MPSALDDRTVAYIVRSQALFEDLRQVAGQLAGLLVLAAAGAEGAAPDHPMLTAAEDLYKQTVDGIERARTNERARPHHDSLRHAACALGQALSAARAQLGKPQADLDAVMVPLRAGYTHLQSAARILPGFNMVAFEQGCCGGGIR
jgi:hypothetical protein